MNTFNRFIITALWGSGVKYFFYSINGRIFDAICENILLTTTRFNSSRTAFTLLRTIISHFICGFFCRFI
jgi:hypothetical protein